MNKNLLHLGMVMLIFLTGINLGWAQTSAFDFNTSGQLVNSFNGSGTHVANVVQSTDGGLNNSGSVSVPSAVTNAVFTSKNSYSLGPVGSSYTFETFIKSTGPNGYSGVGFTSVSPTSTFNTTPVYRPNDALGVSVHGGGYEFHNGNTNYSGHWPTTYNNTITTIKASSCTYLIDDTSSSCGSPDRWYKIVFKVTRATSTTFNMRVEVWPAAQDGSLLYPSEASAIVEVNGVTNSTLSSASQLYSYFNFSGHRVTKFDNFSYNLVGATEIQAGAPVVLTESVSLTGNIISVNGNVTSDNGAAVTERGFVYSSSTNPTTANLKVVLGSGTGTFTGSTSALDPGTYYVRAFATNSTGTSYGEEFSETISATPPSVSTNAATAITASGATLNGNVTAEGGAAVSSRGFVYSSSDNTPTIGEGGVTQVSDGSGTGVFSEAITGLSATTTYYYQAFATNSGGTSYGGVESFTTNKIQLTIDSQILNLSKSYDGTNTATVTDIVLEGVRSGDEVTVTGEATYDNASVGENKSITVVYTLGGADGNSIFTLNNLTPGGGATSSDKNFANISKWAQQFTANESGVISSLKLNLYRTNNQSGSFAVELWSGNGTIPTSQLVVLKTLDWTNVPLNNTATTTTDFIELTSLENSYSVVSGTKYWIVVSQPSNGPFAKRWAVNGSGNETASYNTNQNLWTGNGTAIDLGYQIEIEVPGSYITPTNFVVNDGVIIAKELTITGLTGNNKVYDGTTTATVSGTAILNGVETGDEVTLGGTPVFTFANANVGTGIAITASGYELSGADAGNYSLTAPTGLSADITANPPTITSTPTTTIPYGQPYSYSVKATTEGDLETTITAPTLPSWLTFSTAGQSTATRFGNVPGGVQLSGAAGDEDGNIYAIRYGGTEIFKIQPDGTTTSWKSGMISGNVYALHIANGYVYIPRIDNETQSITRVPLNNPSAAEEVFASFLGGAVSLTDKDGFIYAANSNERQILKINESTKTVEVFLSAANGIPAFGPFGLTFDKVGNLYIATWNNKSLLKYDGTTVSTVLSGLPNSVSSIRVDKNGNFYLSMRSGGVRKYTSDFSSFEVVSLTATDNIWSLSFTSSGALVYAKFNTNEVYRLQTGAMLMGTPSKSHVGAHPVVLKAQNNVGFTEQSFTITVTDETAPVVSAFVPANNATEVALQPTLTITFDEEVVLGTAGTLTVNNGGTVLRTYDLSVIEDRNAFVLSENKMTLSVDLDSTLPRNTVITIGISSGFVKDMAENAFAGFAASSNTWRFTTLSDSEPPVITLPNDNTKVADQDACNYTVQGTEFDPISVTDNSGTITSLTYAVKQLKTATSLISEDFNSGAWNPANFEIGSPNGSVVDGAYQSAGGDDRGTLRTVADFIPTAENPLNVSATLRFSGGESIAFIGTRSTGLKNSGYSNEPSNSLYFRIHNFIDGYTVISGTSFDGRPGNAFYTNPIRIEFVDNGSNITGTFTNTVTNQVLSFNENTAYSSGSWRVVFSGGQGVSWDDIQISFGPHESFQEIANGTNSAAGKQLPIGENRILWTATDPAGNESTETISITVEDKQKPAFIAPSNVTENTIGGEKSKELTISNVAVSDNCGIESLIWKMTGATIASGTDQVGTYSFNTGLTTITYTATDIYGNAETTSFTVSLKEAQEITFNPISTKTYGDPSFDLDASASSGLTVEFKSSNTAVATVSGNTVTIVGQGSTIITATQPGNDAYAEAESKTQTLIVNKKALTITATNGNKTYGEENPTLTFSYTGLANGDTKVATEPSISTTATQSSNVGTYPIELDGGSDDNYTITLVKGTLTVGKKAVTITADDKSKTYGEENPALTFTYTGLANGDTKVATEPSISTTAIQSSNVGTYPITLEGGSDDNYTISLVNGTLTVGKKAVTITADDKSKTYGEENPALTFTYTGLTNGDTKVATEPSISTTATQSSNVGTYPITLEGGSDDNYTISLVNGTLTVGKKAVTITADDKSKTYGEENPALTFTYTGLTNGDTKVATEPSISTTATQSSNVGTYPITLEGGSDDNYTITLVSGTLTVGKKAVTITADDKSKTYGEENPALTFTYTGLTNGDTKVTTEPSISTTATKSSSVGTYPITLEGGSDDNYTITLVNGTLTVGKKAVTITADDKSKTYGEENPTLTFSYTGLTNGDTKVATEPSISTTAT
ncbi:MBG domain-containing protein, partial [Algoriphagus persicinus]|uniref:MBG domain-containing protein n=1 Tax=Algoriphagus persicinus TaxID=3108754 RepID=UPI002B3F7C35